MQESRLLAEATLLAHEVHEILANLPLDEDLLRLSLEEQSHEPIMKHMNEKITSSCADVTSRVIKENPIFKQPYDTLAQAATVIMNGGLIDEINKTLKARISNRLIQICSEQEGDTLEQMKQSTFHIFVLELPMKNEELRQEILTRERTNLLWDDNMFLHRVKYELKDEDLWERFIRFSPKIKSELNLLEGITLCKNTLKRLETTDKDTKEWEDIFRVCTGNVEKLKLLLDAYVRIATSEESSIEDINRMIAISSDVESVLAETERLGGL